MIDSTTDTSLIELDTELEFKAWPKIPRGQHERVVITEKMDGTNACIIIREGKIVGIQSRKKFIQPGKQTDNMGFAAWVYANAADLIELGDGEHYGEWCGPKIQNNPHNLDEKTFFLFNTFRWNPEHIPPTCCKVVPVLYDGDYTSTCITECMDKVLTEASTEVTPEGVIVYYCNTRRNEKHTFRDQKGKWRTAND